MQRVLVIVLLALTGVLGVAAGEPPVPAAAMTAVPVVEPVTWFGGESAVSGDDARSHVHDAVSLLCLCALVVVGVLSVTGRRAPLHWQRRRVRAIARPTRAMPILAPVRLTDPLSWGVCRR